MLEPLRSFICALTVRAWQHRRTKRSTISIEIIKVGEAGDDIGVPDSLQSVVEALVGIARLNMLVDSIVMFAGGNTGD